LVPQVKVKDAWNSAGVRWGTFKICEGDGYIIPAGEKKNTNLIPIHNTGSPDISDYISIIDYTGQHRQHIISDITTPDRYST